MINNLDLEIMLQSTLTLLLLGLVLISCSEKSPSAREDSLLVKPENNFVRNKEAREDSLELAEAFELQAQVEVEVAALFETEPVESVAGEDAADDPAFWFNQDDPEKSLVFGTNKKGGIYAYRLDGEEQAYYPVGHINNIDIRTNIQLGDKKIDLLGGSNRSDNSVVLFQITPDGELTQFKVLNGIFDTIDIDEVYGFCLYKSAGGNAYPIVNGKNGKIRMFELEVRSEHVNLNAFKEWSLNTQPEGMVVDDQNNLLFIGEEEKGIWRVSLDGDSRIELIRSSTKEHNSNIEYDIEGLAIYRHPSGDNNQGFLLASIQGSFSYAVFERTGENRYITSFKIVSNDKIDGVEETDGLEIFGQPLSEDLPLGLLIVQDGFNYDNGVMVNQNFKLVSLEKLIEQIPL